MIVSDGDGGISTGPSGAFQVTVGGFTVALEEVVPNLRKDAVGEINIHFSKMVNGFDRSNLSLTRDGVPISLNGVQGLSTTDNRNWLLNRLSVLTSDDGIS